MKVLHINTYNSGGAANAAIRLHNGLMDEGVQSNFISLYGQKKDIKNSYFFPEIKTSIIQKVLNRIGLPTTNAQKNWQKIKGLAGQFEMLSFAQTDYNILDHEVYKNADIINLHFVANFIDIPSFFKQNKKPVVWTLHDLNPIMGLFHYDEDAKRNKAQFSTVDLEEEEIKVKAIQDSSKLEMIGPSDWITDRARKSHAFGNKNCHHIYNSIDVKIFKQADTSALRQEFNLPLDKQIFLFVSEDLNSKRKGFKILLEAIKIINDPNVIFVAIGSGFPESEKQKNLVALGPIDGPENMAKLYALADAFILPSTEDNLPNTMLESLCCGTPVIAFPIGGIPDVVIHNENGLLAKEISANGLVDVIKQFLTKDTFNRDLISSQSANKFKLEVQAKRYLEVYKNLLNQ